MTDEKWSKFFELLDEIVNLPGVTAADKVKEFKMRMHLYGAETNCTELAAYIDDATDGTK